MSEKLQMRNAVLCAWAEYTKWLLNPRSVIIMVLAVFLYNFVTEPLLSAGEEMGAFITLLEPFIAAGTSSMVMLILPIVFLTLICDFPKTDSNSFFYIIRIGRINWVIGQILFLFLSILTYLLALFLCSVVPVFSQAEWSLGWSDVATKYVSVFPERYGSFEAALLPANLYNHMEILPALLHTYALLALYLLELGCVMLLLSLFKHKQWGFVIAGGLIVLGTALCSIKSSLMWFLPMANAVVWLHYDEYFRKPVRWLGGSYLYFTALILGMMLLAVLLVKRYNYDAVQET